MKKTIYETIVTTGKSPVEAPAHPFFQAAFCKNVCTAFDKMNASGSTKTLLASINNIAAYLSKANIKFSNATFVMERALDPIRKMPKEKKKLYRDKVCNTPGWDLYAKRWRSKILALPPRKQGLRAWLDAAIALDDPDIEPWKTAYFSEYDYYKRTSPKKAAAKAEREI
jgi:hypothetical protein